jgi:hypothetical protein
MEEAAGVDKVVTRMLDIGCGCSMPDDDTTENQVKKFDKLTYLKVYGT